ncbi:MAG: DNA primase [Anaerolineae bacterium]|nr:DNA primase [Anaerolineae bacterium]
MTAVDEIKARLDIVDVVSEHASLRKSGSNYKGLCPFHSEKTPSFIVFPATQTWHCFGACGTGGDVFSFVMKRENLDFAEALRTLAQKAGVQLEPTRQRDTERDKHLEKLFEIHAAAVAFYQGVLRSAAGQTARAYAAQRGLDEETIGKFQLGYAPDEWRALGGHLIERGYERQDLLEAGLIIAHEDGGTYDRFRGRFIIPIRDTRGQVIGFGGRILAEGQPKYLNSPQTPLFNKSHVLFGLDLAKGAIRAKGYVVIVEGYMDVLQAHQAGFGNVVASMGTALTEQHLGLLKRMTKRYILSLDPDLAGDQGTLRGLTVARQTLDREIVPVPTARGWIRYESRLDADIRIMTLPPGQDPDDLIRETPEQWIPMVEAAIPVVDYYFQVSTRDLKMTEAKGKAEAVRRLGPILSEIRDEVERTHYVQKLARLISADEGTVRRQLSVSRPRQHSRRAGEPQQPAEQPRPSTFALEEYCLAVLLRRPDFLERVHALFEGLSLPMLQEDDFERVENRTLYAVWRQMKEGHDWQAWADALPDALQAQLDLILAHGPDTEALARDEVVRDIERAVLLLRRKGLERVSQNLRILFETMERGDAAAAGYSRTMVRVTAERAAIEHALSERTSLGRREERERVL